MQKFKTIREAMTMSPYAIGMAQAKKMYGYGKGPATDLPKKVIKKAHDIAKRVKANESFEDLVDESVDLTDKNEKGVTYKGMGTDVVNKKKKLNPSIPLTQKDRQVKDYMEEVENLHEVSKGPDHEIKVGNFGDYDHYTYHGHINGKKFKSKVGVGFAYGASKKDLENASKQVKVPGASKQEQDKVQSIVHGHLKKDFNMKEEVKDLDELSKKTLGSYAQAATMDAAKKGNEVAKIGNNLAALAHPMSPLNKLNKRLAGHAQAINKLTKEEVEEIDELSKKTLAAYAMSASSDAVKNQRKQSNYQRVGDDDDEAPGTQKLYTRMANKAGEKKVKRLSGIATALSKLAKEEVENIDELSKKTLGSYVNKAVTSVHNLGYNAGSKMSSGDVNTGMKSAINSIKRQTNINTAVKKLAKEDIEEIDELSRNTMSSYVSKASDASKYKGMSTSKVDKRYSGVAQASKKLDKMNQSASSMAKEAKEEMPTGIKIYHKNKNTGQEGSAIQFTVKNAQAHIKDLKKAGHSVTGKSLMFGKKEGPRKPMGEEKLDELKKSTYGDYINRASRSLRASASIRKDFERDAERDAGRAYKSGIEPAEKERHLKNYEVNKGLAADFAKDSEKRLKGISRATKKLSK